MAVFSARNISASIVPVDAERIWTEIADPASLTALTPLVRSIVVAGDLWRWQLAGIEALGVCVAPTFTERMEFIQPRLIRFSHEAPKGARERAGADGVYELTPHDEGVRGALGPVVTLQAGVDVAGYFWTTTSRRAAKVSALRRFPNASVLGSQERFVGAARPRRSVAASSAFSLRVDRGGRRQDHHLERLSIEDRSSLSR